MQKYIIRIILFLLFTNLNGQKMKFEIIPIPQKLNIIDGTTHFRFPQNSVISFNTEKSEKLSTIEKLLNEKLTNRIGINPKFVCYGNKGTTIKLNLINEFNSSDSIPEQFVDEAYVLTISNSIILAEAKTLKGIYYASLTLSQIIDNSENNEFPELKIVDFPNMKFRGISDDISRGQVSTLENFKRIIKFISEYKMNTYMPYLEDMIQFNSYPEIGIGRGALSKKEIKEIVKYAENHFVEVIPILETLGHYENILSQKQFIKYADYPGAASLDVTNPGTYIFLEKILDEVFKLFPSKYIHIGGDESYDVGLGNSRKLLANSDLATIHSNHYKKVYDICTKNNKKVMMYGDMILDHPDILKKIPEDITIVDWHYHPQFIYPSTAIFDSTDFNYIVSPSVWNFSSAFPNNFFAIPNIQQIINNGINHNSIGMINSSWGDFGAETFREYNLYGYAWSAECAWNIGESNSGTFNKTFFKHFFGTDDNRIEKIYDDLTNPVNQLSWNNLWRHPLLHFRKPDWRQFDFPHASKYYWMKSEDDDLQNLSDFKKSATQNNDFLELLEFTLKLKNWFILKQETQIYLQDMLDNQKVDKQKILDLVDQNISDLKKLKNEFSKLWKKYNKQDNLWMVKDKFERLITYFAETKSQIIKNKLKYPLLESKWIYYPVENDKYIWNVTFSKSLQIDGQINSAQLQIIGDTFAKLFINGKKVDSVYAKRSGSLWVEQKRIKMLNIKDFLHQGENKIIVEAKNYYNKTTPGINIISQIITENDTIYFSTDDSWKVQNENSHELLNAEVKDNSWEIIAPNFTTNRKSWIER